MWLNQEPGVSVVDEIYCPFQLPTTASMPLCWIDESVLLADSTNFYTDYAINLIRHRDKSKPFYLHQTYQAVHAPWQEPPEWEQIPAGSDFWWVRSPCLSSPPGSSTILVLLESSLRG